MAGMAVAAALLGGCVENSPTIATFDQELESTTFDNRLLTPIILYRDGNVLDTLPARDQRTYAIGRRGVIRHAWRILPPIDSRGRKAGIEPYVELGVQYRLNANYRLDDEAVPGWTIFTPRILNASPDNLRLIVNYHEDEEFNTDYYIRSNSNSSLTHAPYYYWHRSSNVILAGGIYTYSFSRQDTNDFRRLRISDSSSVEGAGLTEPLLAR
jgi:hypothetical protein